LSEEMVFIEKGEIPKGSTLMVGLPDVGLVGVIALSHIVSSLKMEEVGSIESKMFPPIVVLHGGVPKPSIRIFAKGNLVAILSEMAIPAGLVVPLAEGIVDWAYKKGVKMILSMGGIAVQNRQDLDKPKVFSAISDKSLEKYLDGITESLEEGYMVGAYAIILKRCSEVGLPGITLLAQTFFNYPDPEAAAVTIEVVNKLLNLNIDYSELLKKGEEIRLRARDVMRRTQEEMIRMNKAQEYDIPAIYG
jgi:uncharacterized protein